MVTATYRPYDVTHFRSRDAAAAVLLANSLDWTVNQRHDGPVSLVAKDGKQIRVPDNTGIKMDIFRGWIHQIATHSGDLSISRRLVDDIVKQTKLGREHARLMYELAEDEAPEPMGEMQQMPGAEPDHQPLLPRGWYDENAVVLTREPFVSVNAKSDESFAYIRTWSDDRVDYECMYCDRIFDTVKAVGAHQQFHIRRGHLPGKEIKPDPKAKRPGSRRQLMAPEEPLARSARRNVVVDRPDPSTRMIEISEEVATQALEALKRLEQIRALLGADEVSALKEELATKNARIAQLEGNLQALRELLAGDL